jgi:hypothetical protein
VIVRCEYLTDSIGRPSNLGRGLKVGVTYTVLGLIWDINGSLYVRILLNEIPWAALFLLDQFSIVDGDLSNDWILTKNSHGVVELMMRSFSEPRFWDKFYDEDPRAIQIFEREVRKFS